MSEIETLQKVINMRAEQRLDADLLEAAKLIRANRLFSNESLPNLTYLVQEKDEKAGKLEKTATNTPYWVFQFQYFENSRSINSSAYMDKVKAFWLPVYIAEETQTFIEKLDQVRNDVDYLLEKSPE